MGSHFQAKNLNVKFPFSIRQQYPARRFFHNKGLCVDELPRSDKKHKFYSKVLTEQQNYY
jgi:hypothetical protein